MTPLQIYWLLVITKLPDVGGGLIVLGCVIGFVYFMTSIDAYNQKEKDKLKPLIKASIIVIIFGVLLAIFAPTKKDLAIMYGVSYATNNEQVQKLPNNVLEVVNVWLEEAKEDIKN